MVHLLRKYQQSLLIAITILVIITFVWFWNGNQGRGGGGFSTGNTIAILGGQKITDTEFQREARKCQVAMSLGLDELVRTLAGNAESENQAVQNYIWSMLTLRREADRLQIVPADAEVQKALMNVPAFQTDGQFDANKLSLYVQNELPSRGFTDTVIDDLLRDYVRMKKIEQLIGGAVDLTPAELKSRYVEANQKIDLSVARLSLSDIEKQITISDADAKQAYEQRKDQYKSPEQRKIKVAAFELSDAQKQLKGKDRTQALQALANKAWEFAQTAMTKAGANFDEQATKAGAAISTTGFFSEAEPDPALSKAPAIAPNAFRLTNDYPTSDVVEGQNGYYVVHLEGVTPSQQLSFEQAKSKVLDQLKHERATQVLQNVGNTLRNKMLADMKSGKSFADAAKSAGLAAETIPPFSLTEAGKSDVPDLQQILQAGIGLPDKQLSDLVQTEAGGLFVYVSGREPIPPATLAMGEMTSKDDFARKQRVGAFEEWLRLRVEAGHLQIVQR